jgi:hypothetical protein
MPCIINFQVKYNLGDHDERIAKPHFSDFANRFASGVASSKPSKSKYSQAHQNFEISRRS